MKRYCEFTMTSEEGLESYYLIDVTKIALISHDSDKGVNGTTTIAFGHTQYAFSGGNNKNVYDTIISLMHELETAE